LLAQALLCAKEYRCAAEVVTIIAMLSSPNIFFVPFEQRDEVCQRLVCEAGSGLRVSMGKGRERGGNQSHGQALRPTTSCAKDATISGRALFTHLMN
jgi:HrpA-like RNA helicase